MQVRINSFNYNNPYNSNYYANRKSQNYQPSYTGNSSKIFEPFSKGLDNFSEWIANNYFKRFYQSDFAKKFGKATSNVKNMTTHMAALGSTLISSMYVVRTLNNENLDADRRKTLAINDGLTWLLSTVGAYTIDGALAKWWDGVTTRYAANYLDNHSDEIFANEDFNKILDKYCKSVNIEREDLHKHIIERYNKHLDEALDKYCSENHLDKNKLDAKTLKMFKKLPIEGDLDPKYLNVYMREYNSIVAERNAQKLARINKIREKHPELAKKLERVKLIDPANGIREFNLDVLKNRALTTKIDGMGILKSLFVFGMVYRYIIPVLVMKPANKIGAYVHKKKLEKEQADQTKN